MTSRNVEVGRMDRLCRIRVGVLHKAVTGRGIRYGGVRGEQEMDREHVPVLKPAAARRRHWWIAALALLVVLGSYAATLAWVTRRLETDVQKSIHPVPAVLAADHGDA